MASRLWIGLVHRTGARRDDGEWVGEGVYGERDVYKYIATARISNSE